MFIKRICKLIDIKSIMTLSLTYVFVSLSLKETIPAENFLNVFLIIVGFYFGTQHEKKKEADNYDSTTMDTEKNI